MSASHEVFQCLTCHGSLDISFPADRSFSCTHCNQLYYVIAGIPILVDHGENYIAESFQLYHQHATGLDYQIGVVTNNFASIPARQNLKIKFTEAVAFNKLQVEKIIQTLEPHTSVKALMNVKTNSNNDTNRYLKDFEYLRRDWSGHPEGEEQLSEIHRALAVAIDQHSIDRDNILVLGAGTGRIAYELKRFYRTVLATDLSFSMAYHFHRVMEEDVFFYELNTQNVYQRDAFTRKIKASRKGLAEGDGVIQYFISDVKKLPLKDKSVACIASVYFTDVLALKLWLPEIKRVLKPGGMFIHFGPLGYPFEDFREKLSAEEIKDVLIANDFSIVVDDLVSTNHMASALTLTKNIYTNWSLAAVYKAKDDTQLTGSSIPSIQTGIQYTLTGKINDDLNEEVVCRITNDFGNKISGTTFLLTLLRSVDNKASVSEIIESLSEKFDLAEQDREEIVGMFRMMEKEKFISCR